MHKKPIESEKTENYLILNSMKFNEIAEGLLVIILSSGFNSCDVSLLTIITYFRAIQRGLQYFYGPFL